MKYLAAILAFTLTWAAYVPVFAEDYTSAHFITSNPNSNVIGGQATSTNFDSSFTAGQMVTGEATSTNFTLQMGFQYFDSPTFKSQNWRWYDDAENETPLTPLANENTAPADIDTSNTISLRISIEEGSGLDSINQKFKVQFSSDSLFSEGGTDVAETVSCVGSSRWCYADGGGTDGAVISTKLLTDADACSGGVGDGCGTHNESGVSASTYTHVANAVAEYEFTIKEAGATANTTYFFRLVDAKTDYAVPLQSGASYPSVVTGGTSLSFQINGLPSATSTGGVTTDIDTSSTAVSFGTLPIGADQVAAHRLIVTTNASSGYGVYVIQLQGLLGSGGGEIAGVTGTNPSPSPWNSGCTGSAAGCFGYHTTDAVLGVGSATRFAADDTYAKFETAPREVAYYGEPIASSTVDMIYRVEARSLQDAGDYSTRIAYIVVPTF